MRSFEDGVTGDVINISSRCDADSSHLRGERVPGEILLPVQVVDRTNYARWDKPFAERESPRWEDVVN